MIAGGGVRAARSPVPGYHLRPLRGLSFAFLPCYGVAVIVKRAAGTTVWRS